MEAIASNVCRVVLDRVSRSLNADAVPGTQLRRIESGLFYTYPPGRDSCVLPLPPQDLQVRKTLLVMIEVRARGFWVLGFWF